MSPLTVTSSLKTEVSLTWNWSSITSGPKALLIVPLRTILLFTVRLFEIVASEALRVATVATVAFIEPAVTLSPTVRS